jgi:hypothetical protein
MAHLRNHGSPGALQRAVAETLTPKPTTTYFPATTTCHPDVRATGDKLATPGPTCHRPHSLDPRAPD